MSRTGPLELLGIDHLLTEEERDIQATVREWVSTTRQAEYRRLVRAGGS
jgi:hypothetical protein